MIKLGFWPRLAIAAGGLFCLIGPSAAVIANNRAQTARATAGYASCMKLVPTDPTGQLTWEACEKIWFGSDAGYLGWDDWWVGVALAGGLWAVFCALIWGAALVARWVWRGRTA